MYIHHLLNSNEYREQIIQKQIQIDIRRVTRNFLGQGRFLKIRALQ